MLVGKTEANPGAELLRVLIQESFSGNGTRTYDRTDMSRLLYQLSYAATSPFNGDMQAYKTPVFMSSAQQVS